MVCVRRRVATPYSRGWGAPARGRRHGAPADGGAVVVGDVVEVGQDRNSAIERRVRGRRKAPRVGSEAPAVHMAVEGVGGEITPAVEGTAPAARRRGVWLDVGGTIQDRRESQPALKGTRQEQRLERKF